MTASTSRWIILILATATLAGWVVWPDNPGIHLDNPTLGIHYDRDIRVQQGLDLKGGLQILLEADLPDCSAVSADDMETAKFIIDNRVNGLGVTEALVQVQGACRLVVELPGVADPEQAVATIKQAGLLEFVDVGYTPLPAGTQIQTDYGGAAEADGVTVYHTVMTGAALEDASVTRDQVGRYLISFTLTDEAAQVFGEFTSTHIGQSLAIVLDKTVISAPQINDAITTGQGQITGNFTEESANALVIQLRYGALPVPLKVVQSQTVGPTLGQDSVRKSFIAGGIGLAAVVLFMALYYRLPGLLAAVALGMYALVTFAIFKLVPVTLTLPGIAGFILSVGVAVDANILIFERMKEELRGGRNLRTAVDIGFSRAWPSIRDSNVSTLITCAILFWFGSTFGASIVKGFALTLAIGVGVSLFTAITVTRTLMHLILDRINFSERHAWFGI